MIEVVIIANPGPDILGKVVRLLDEVGLPTCDIDSMDLFAHFSDLKKILGIGGVQFFGSDRLIRSIAITPSRQGEGIGTSIVKHILATPRVTAGNIYVFTSTAEEFFKRFGFSRIPWSAVPQKIISSPLVSLHCRKEAIPMMMVL